MVFRRALVAIAAIGLSVGVAAAQSFNSEHTLRLDDHASRQAVSVEDLAWIVGHWRGEGFGGTIEEIWAPPLGGSMLGLFRLVQDGKPRFYELVSLEPQETSVVLRVKHFTPEMVAWEEKEKTVDFPLIRIEEGKAYFNGLTFEKDGPEGLNIYIVLSRDGVKTEHLLKLKRFKH